MSEERSAGAARGARGSAEDPIPTLENWRDAGAEYRVVHLSERLAVVDLCTCYGEPVDRLESRDRRLIEYLFREESKR